jgi:hypothetical protein
MALSATRITDVVGGVAIPRKNERPVRDAVTLYKGGMVAADNAGDYVPAGHASAVTQCQGVLMEVTAIEETVTGAAASPRPTARLTVGIFWFDNSAGDDAITATHLGQVCYAVDDETVALSDGNGSRYPAGTVTDVDATNGVAVSIIPQIPLLGASTVKRVAATIGIDESGEDFELSAAGLTQTFNLGSALPATAMVLGVRLKLDAVFANASAASLTLKLGHDGDDDAYETGFDIFTGSAHAAGEWQLETAGVGKVAPAAIATAGLRQLIATATINADQLVNCTGGPAHVEIFYLDIPSIL